MPRYNHACSIAFVVLSDDRNGDDFTPAMLRESLMDRVEQLDQSSEAAEWLEAVGAPDNTYEQDPHERFPLEDWQQEVANGDTLVGYDEWLNTQVEMASVTDDAEDD